MPFAIWPAASSTLPETATDAATVGTAATSNVGAKTIGVTRDAVTGIVGMGVTTGEVNGVATAIETTDVTTAGSIGATVDAVPGGAMTTGIDEDEAAVVDRGERRSC